MVLRERAGEGEGFVDGVGVDISRYAFVVLICVDFWSLSLGVVSEEMQLIVVKRYYARKDKRGKIPDHLDSR